MKLKFKSMEELDRIVRNVGEDEVIRRAALNELASREHLEVHRLALPEHQYFVPDPKI
jgi:hypothetical protein